MIGNERGIALIITLLVVALLAITVVEFTDSVEVDQHMTRNSLNGLQASLLARSGINLGEAFLLHDNQIQFDAFTEDWCPLAGSEAQSCLIDESNSQVVLPGNMRLRVEILAEDGKFNVNLTRAATLQQLDAWQQSTGTPANPLTVMESLCAARGVDPQIVTALVSYWQKAIAAADQAVGAQTSGGTTGTTTGTATGTATGTTSTANQATSLTPQQIASIKIQILQQYEFASLDDLGVIGITPKDIDRLRPVLTAQKSSLLPPIGLNINTAPRTVLNAVYAANPGEVDNIISQRQNGPLQSPPAGAAQGVRPAVRSNLFLIRASAIVNPDPLTGRGGIRRSASMLVQRVAVPPVPGGTTTAANTLPGGLHWTLRRLDWQKEGGAVLFDPRNDSEPGTDGTASGTAQDFGG